MTCNFSVCISYGNCTEWSDFKSNSCCALVWFWNHVENFRPKLHDPKFNCHFITSILKSHNLIAQIQTRRFWSVPLYNVYWTSIRFVKKRNQKCLNISFWKHVRVMSTWGDCIMWLVVLFYCLILIGGEKDVIWSKK